MSDKFAALKQHFAKQEGDAALSAIQLDDKYNPDGDGEHPVFNKAAWRDEAFKSLTLFGYWEWVADQLQDTEGEDKPFGPG